MEAPKIMSRKDTATGEPTGSWAPARIFSVVLFVLAVLPYPAMLAGLGPPLSVLETLGMTIGLAAIGMLVHNGMLGGLAERAGEAAVSRFDRDS